MTEENMDEYAFKYNPPGMKDWVQRRTQDLGRRPRRMDEVKHIPVLAPSPSDHYQTIGVYSAKPGCLVGETMEEKFELAIKVPMPNSPELMFNRPKLPSTTEHIGADLAKFWEVFNARIQRREQEMPPLLNWIVQLARWKYEEATTAVRGYEASNLPLAPEWQYYVKLCNDSMVGKQGQGLAVLLNCGPW